MRGCFLWLAGMFLAMVLSPCPAFSHGVLARISQGPALVITAGFDDGEPVSYAGVEILYTGETLPFQTGQTDRKGRFLFLPDRDGEWRAVINDGMGHRAVVRTQWQGGASDLNSGEKPDTVLSGAWARAVSGVGLILGVCFMIRFLILRRRRRSD